MRKTARFLTILGVHILLYISILAKPEQGLNAPKQYLNTAQTPHEQNLNKPKRTETNINATQTPLNT